MNEDNKSTKTKTSKNKIKFFRILISILALLIIGFIILFSTSNGNVHNGTKGALTSNPSVFKNKTHKYDKELKDNVSSLSTYLNSNHGKVMKTLTAKNQFNANTSLSTPASNKWWKMFVEIEPSLGGGYNYNIISNGDSSNLKRMFLTTMYDNELLDSRGVTALVLQYKNKNIATTMATTLNDIGGYGTYQINNTIFISKLYLRYNEKNVQDVWNGLQSETNDLPDYHYAYWYINLKNILNMSEYSTFGKQFVSKLGLSNVNKNSAWIGYSTDPAEWNGSLVGGTVWDLQSEKITDEMKNFLNSQAKTVSKQVNKKQKTGDLIVEPRASNMSKLMTIENSTDSFGSLLNVYSSKQSKIKFNNPSEYNKKDWSVMRVDMNQLLSYVFNEDEAYSPGETSLPYMSFYVNNNKTTVDLTLTTVSN